MKFVMTAAGQDRSSLHSHWDPLPHGSLMLVGEVASTHISRVLLDLQPSSAPTAFLSLKYLFSLCLSPLS